MVLPARIVEAETPHYLFGIYVDRDEDFVGGGQCCLTHGASLCLTNDLKKERQPEFMPTLPPRVGLCLGQGDRLALETYHYGADSETQLACVEQSAQTF